MAPGALSRGFEAAKDAGGLFSPASPLGREGAGDGKILVISPISRANAADAFVTTVRQRQLPEFSLRKRAIRLAGERTALAFPSRAF
jgi:hypothetical protein